MTPDAAVSLVNTVGFPIAVCVMLWRQYQAERDRRAAERENWQEVLQDVSNTLNEIHNEVTD